MGTELESPFDVVGEDFIERFTSWRANESVAARRKRNVCEAVPDLGGSSHTFVSFGTTGGVVVGGTMDMPVPLEE